MKQTITVSSLEELRKFKTEFIEIRDIVKSANGKYLVFVEKRRDSSPAAQSMFITKREFDLALSPAMRTGSPAAFSPHIAGGGFTENRLNLAYAAYQRAQARADITDTVLGSALIRNKHQFIAVYGERLGLYPPGRMGDFLNAITSEALRSKL